MDVVSVNATNSGEPEGRWKGDPDRASKADYLVEEHNGEVYKVYEFTGVSKLDADGRFSFKGLKDVTDTQPDRYVKDNLDVSRKQGEQAPLRYDSI